MSEKQKQVEIYIQEDLGAAQRAEFVEKLELERGIVTALFKGGDHHRLTVDYECDHFSQLTLLDTIKTHGLHGKISGG
jgi:hypothetical protein